MQMTNNHLTDQQTTQVSFIPWHTFKPAFCMEKDSFHEKDDQTFQQIPLL